MSDTLRGHMFAQGELDRPLGRSPLPVFANRLTAGICMWTREHAGISHHEAARYVILD